jgi:hypothetical protein
MFKDLFKPREEFTKEDWKELDRKENKSMWLILPLVILADIINFSSGRWD